MDPSRPNLRRWIRERLEEENVRPAKKLGQHFLADAGLLERIVEELSPLPDQLIVEVGAGIGTLTERIARNAGRVIALEIDVLLIPILQRSTATCENVDIVVCDALEFPIERASTLRLPVRGVGNLPYQIASPLIISWAAPPSPIVDGLYMVQKEVADRLRAAPGDRERSSMSALVQARWEVQQVIRVPARAFLPPPRVSSAVIRLTPRTDPVVSTEDWNDYRRVVAAAFSHRRKQLHRSLTHAGMKGAIEILEEAGIDPTRRAETMETTEFLQIARAARRLGTRH